MGYLSYQGVVDRLPKRGSTESLDARIKCFGLQPAFVF